MKDRFYSQTTSHLQATTASIRSPMTTTVLTDFTATNVSLEGHRLQAASQTFSRVFADTVYKGNRNSPLSPEGNFIVKSSDFLEGLFEKSFCSTKQVSLLLHS